MTKVHSQSELSSMVDKAINGVRAVMVGVAGEPYRFHPMRGHVVPGERSVWFICPRDVSLVKELEGPAHAAVVNVVSEDHHLHASLGGTMVAERDQGRIDQFWSSVADAWLPEGRLSPDVITLRFDPTEAEAWISDNSFKLAWEVARANLDHAPVQSGERALLRPI